MFVGKREKSCDLAVNGEADDQHRTDVQFGETLGYDKLSSGNMAKIQMNLARLPENEVEVTVHDGVVTVSGEKSSEKEETGETYFFSERTYGSFSRSFRLPPDADAAKVDARLKDGLLTIRVPKRVETAPEGAQKVKIKAG